MKSNWGLHFALAEQSSDENSIELKGNSHGDCFQLAPDEEREGPDFDGTSRRLKPQKSNGEREELLECKAESFEGTSEAATSSRGLVADRGPKEKAWRSRMKVYKEEARAQSPGLAKIERKSENSR